VLCLIPPRRTCQRELCVVVVVVVGFALFALFRFCDLFFPFMFEVYE
jgi:hypothetical protein